MKLRLPVLLCLFAAGASSAFAGSIDLLVATQHTFAVLPATSITDGDVSEVSWSPDGEHLLVAERSDATSTEALLTFSSKERVNGPLVLLGWDRATHQARRLWSAENPTAQIDQISWLHKTSSALLTVTWTAPNQAGVEESWYGVLFINAATGEFHWLPGLETLPTEPKVYPSPTVGKALITFNENAVQSPPQKQVQVNLIQGLLDNLTVVKTAEAEQNNGNQVTFSLSYVSAPSPATNFWTIDQSGQIARSIHLEKPLELSPTWNADGSNWFLIQSDPTTHRQVLMSLSEQGILTPTNEVAYQAPEKGSELSVDESEASVEHGKTKVSTHPLWLHGDKPEGKGTLLLSPDGQEPQLSPSERAVFFIDHGVAKVREIAAVTPQQVAKAEQLESQRPRTMTFRISLLPGSSSGGAKAVP